MPGWCGRVALLGGLLTLSACGAGYTPRTAAPSPFPTWTEPVTWVVLPTATVSTTPAVVEIAPVLVPPDVGRAQDAAESVPLVSTPATVTVQAGDTLLGLALRYAVPMAALQLENDLGAVTMIRLGQVLVIPSAAAWSDASPFWVVHEAAAGETLAGIAQTYAVDLARLQAVNAGIEDVLSAGQWLVLPLDGPVAAATVAPMVAPTVAPPIAPAPPMAVAPPPADIAAWPYETVRIMNEVRAGYGLPPLLYNETLAAAAQAHANDCAARGACSHTGSDGADIKTRIVRAGYSPASWAECWAQRQTPQGAIEVWMDEIPPNDPHRRTLLTEWFTEIGVGVAQTTWGYYFIADFGKPK